MGLHNAHNLVGRQALRRSVGVLMVFGLATLFTAVSATPADAKRSSKRTAKRTSKKRPTKRVRKRHVRDIPTIKLPATFSQKDKRWSRDRVGGSNESLRKVGCVVTSVAMTFNYFGVRLDPKQLNAALRERKGGYNRRGWLSWLHAQRLTQGKLKLVYNGMFREARLDATLQRGIPVIVKTRSVRNSIHWMVVVGKRKGQYLVHDPLHIHGRVVPFKKVAKKIYQMRIYEQPAKTASTRRRGRDQ